MQRAEIEAAIVELQSLLSDDDCPEFQFQAWFERHRVAFDVYGYANALPHPRLEHPEGVLIPDFLVQRVDGAWEVLELKRAVTGVNLDGTRRTFRAEFEEHCSQCRSYARFFEQDVLREQFNTTAGLDIASDLRAVIVAGRREAVDVARVRRELADRGAKIVLQTYDDVREQLEFYRAKLFARDENRPGFFAFLFFVPKKRNGETNWIFDFGTLVDRDRVSLMIEPSDVLVLTVRSAEGVEHRVAVPLEKAGILYGLPTYIFLQFGLGKEDSFLSLEINGQHYADRRLDAFSLSPDALEHCVLGSDVLTNGGSEFSIIEWGYGNATASFDQRWRMVEYMSTRYADVFENFDLLPPRLTFSGHQWMATQGHPAHNKSAGCS